MGTVGTRENFRVLSLGVSAYTAFNLFFFFLNLTLAKRPNVWKHYSGVQFVRKLIAESHSQVSDITLWVGGLPRIEKLLVEYMKKHGLFYFEKLACSCSDVIPWGPTLHVCIPDDQVAPCVAASATSV